MEAQTTTETDINKTEYPEKQKSRYYFWKAVLWLAMNLFFGLLPLILIWFISSIVGTEIAIKIRTEAEKFINDCGLMFIFIVIMGAVTTDYFLSPIRFHKVFEAMIYIIAGFSVLIVAMLYFARILNNEGTKIGLKETSFNIIQYALMFISSFLIIMVKSNLLKREEI